MNKPAALYARVSSDRQKLALQELAGVSARASCLLTSPINDIALLVPDWVHIACITWCCGFTQIHLWNGATHHRKRLRFT